MTSYKIMENAPKLHNNAKDLNFEFPSKRPEIEKISNTKIPRNKKIYETKSLRD